MKLDDERVSGNVEDRRGSGMGGKAVVGIGTVIIALVAGYFFDIDPSTIMNIAGGLQSGQQQTAPAASGPPADEAGKNIGRVLAKTEDVWTEIFKRGGAEYRPPKLVLFTGRTPTACGTGQAAMGPFYCPGDEKVYIDLSFYRDLDTRFGAPGDFAQAYVVAHEVGHHVQHLLGTSRKVDALRGKVSQTQFNQASVRLELQADCYAGLWARQAQEARAFLEAGDLEEALNAASAIGDDRLQKQSQGHAVPDSFTHGSSAQRVRWFKAGYESGSLQACDTFKARQL